MKYERVLRIPIKPVSRIHNNIAILDIRPLLRIDLFRVSALCNFNIIPRYVTLIGREMIGFRGNSRVPTNHFVKLNIINNIHHLRMRNSVDAVAVNEQDCPRRRDELAQGAFVGLR